MNPQCDKIHNLAMSKLPLGNFKKLCHFNATFVENYRIYYREEGDDSSQVQAMAKFVDLC